MTETSACTTDPYGVCEVFIVVTEKKQKNVAFTVLNLAPAGEESYVRLQNHDDDGNSDGTSIVIVKP